MNLVMNNIGDLLMAIRDALSIMVSSTVTQ